MNRISAMYDSIHFRHYVRNAAQGGGRVAAMPRGTPLALNTYASIMPLALLGEDGNHITLWNTVLSFSNLKEFKTVLQP
jgi:hypothetical protein